MPFTDRATFIALLKRLESDSDQDVVAAAREITRRMKDGAVAWEDLIVPAGGAANDDIEEAPASADPPPADDDADEKGLGEAAASEELAMIRAMLARDDLSDSTRSDLQDFAEDIAQGRLRPADSRYVRALHKRLIG